MMDYRIHPTDLNLNRPVAETGVVPVPSDCVVFPGFCDVHVHFREPGFSYKETIASGTAAAARGGSPMADSALRRMWSTESAPPRARCSMHAATMLRHG